MRILLVSDFFPPVAGGLEFHVQTLAAELTAQGHDVRIATLTDDPVPGETFVVSTLATSVRVLPHERPDRPFHPPLADPVTRHSLGKVMAEYRPDVVHAHSWLAASVPHGRAPLVFTAHDYSLICQRKTLLQPGNEPCTGPALRKCIDCGAELYGRLKSTLLAPATVAGRKRLRPDRIVAVSSAVRAALEPHVSGRIDVVSNFVSPAPPDTPLPAAVSGTGFVMYAGDAAAHKGVDQLIAVWERPRPPSARLVLATPTPVRRDLPHGVVNVSLTRDQVRTAMARATTVVVPSLWGEPCPTVVLEAMQAGTPVVASNVGGIPDLVDAGSTGLLVPAGDTDRLTTAISHLIAHPDQAAAMGEAARARAESFTVGVIAGQLTSIYREAIAAGES